MHWVAFVAPSVHKDKGDCVAITPVRDFSDPVLNLGFVLSYALFFAHVASLSGDYAVILPHLASRRESAG